MAAHTPKKILIVEDEVDIAQLVKLYLEKEGFRTVTAKTGVEGLKLIKTDRPDMVVLDLMLPQMDGLEICKKIPTAPETALLPVLMLTAKAEESDTIIGLELGADDYVTHKILRLAFLSFRRGHLKTLCLPAGARDDSTRRPYPCSSPRSIRILEGRA